MEQQAHRMHSYKPSILFLSVLALIVLCAIPAPRKNQIKLLLGLANSNPDTTCLCSEGSRLAKVDSCYKPPARCKHDRVLTGMRCCRRL